MLCAPVSKQRSAFQAVGLEQNLVATTAIPELPADVLAAMDQAWGLCADDAFAFWRSYSSDHPDREALDPGAAYVATKPKL